MNDIQHTGTAIFALALIATGWFLHSAIFPQNPVEETEVEVFVDRVIEVPTEKENYYSTCRSAADRTYLSNWNGDLKDGVKPQDITSFIDQCLNYYDK
jgi:hypothetical protein